MVEHETILIRISIPAEKYLTYYQGATNSVLAQAQDGRKIKFPASFLRPFVTQGGVNGLFALTINKAGKLLDIRRLKK